MSSCCNSVSGNLKKDLVLNNLCIQDGIIANLKTCNIDANSIVVDQIITQTIISQDPPFPLNFVALAGPSGPTVLPFVTVMNLSNPTPGQWNALRNPAAAQDVFLQSAASSNSPFTFGGINGVEYIQRLEPGLYQIQFSLTGVATQNNVRIQVALGQHNLVDPATPILHPLIPSIPSIGGFSITDTQIQGNMITGMGALRVNSALDNIGLIYQIDKSGIGEGITFSSINMTITRLE